MPLIFFIIALVGAFCGLSFIVGYFTGRSKSQSTPNTPTEITATHIGRRGVINWPNFQYDSTPKNAWYTWNKKDVIVVVEEVDRVSDQSKIKILSVDGPHMNKECVQYAKNKLGEWWITRHIQWEKIVPPASEPEPVAVLKDKLSEQDRIIKTPLNVLVKQIENDEIEPV